MITGQKSGKSGGSGGRSPVEDPDTLRSRSTARIVEILSEGPIVGLVDGNKSIYLDETPLQNSDGTYNWSGVTVSTRDGQPTQAHVPGFAAVESEVGVNTQITVPLPVTRAITNPNLDAVRIKLQVPRLTQLDGTSGDLHGTTVSVAVDLKTDLGTFTEVGVITISGKSSGAYERQMRVALPHGGAPWTIRLRRLTEDSESSTLANATTFASYTEIIDAKLTYPDSALAAFEIDAQVFGNSLPDRAYHIDGLITPVPSNYNPVTRTYAGIWNGTFVAAYHSNPVWVLWDLYTNNRYGLGDIMPEGLLDKFGLYAISQYCDELVPDGRGGMEPRFSFNGVIASREDAVKVLDAVAATFRGMVYWGAGLVTAVQDAPATPVKLLSPANVFGGDFSYTGVARKARYSVVIVSWNDPNDLSRRTYEVVRRDDLIAKYGLRQKEVNAYGCTSRGQARRYGDWILETGEMETETVSYIASLDHADVRPGQLVNIADPTYAGARFGGRVLASALSVITIDDPVDLEDGISYSLSVVMPDGSIGSRAVVSASGTEVDEMLLGSPLDDTPDLGAMWVLSSTAAAPRTFRVVANREKKANEYEITALLHNKDKYDKIDLGTSVDDESYSIFPSGPLLPPTGLTLVEFFKATGSAVQPAVALAWIAAQDPRVSTYLVEGRHEGEEVWRHIIETSSISTDDFPTVAGNYKFRVRAKAAFASASQWAYYSGFILADGQPIGDVQDFAIDNDGAQATLTWRRSPEVHASHYEIRYNSRVEGATWDTSSVLLERVTSNSTSAVVRALVGSYLIKAVSTSGVSSINAALVTSSIAGTENINVVECLQEDPAWAGVHNDTTTFAGVLRLAQDSPPIATWTPLSSIVPIGGEFLLSGQYHLEDSLDLSGKFRFSMTMELEAEAASLSNTMGSWGTLADLGALSEPGTGVWSVTVMCRTTDDDPNGVAPVWSDWFVFKNGFYFARAVEFRVDLNTERSTVSPAVTKLKICADMEDRVTGVADTACPPAGIVIAYEQAFLNVPTVHIDGQGLNTGDYHRVTGKTENGFTLNFYNSSNAAKAATFDWIAKGYGYRQ